MAKSSVATLLPLDDWARIMSIPGWVFNQVRHPLRNVPGCDGVVYQSGYTGDTTYFIGRDEIATAIATAEGQIASVLGYWPAPKFICDERIPWIHPARGRNTNVPVLKTRWGYVVGFGFETFVEVDLAAAIVYSDTDGDGIDDWAVIEIIALYGAAVTSACDVVVVYPDEDPCDPEWHIRGLEVTLDPDTDAITIEGPMWMFVAAGILLTDGEAVLGTAADFLATVDVYRRVHDTNPMGYIVWDHPCATGVVCASESVIGCCQIKDTRLGQFTMIPASWDETLGGWVRDLWTYGYPPDWVQVSYLAGYDDNSCIDCSQIGPRLKMAIARLANIYIADLPCGCSLFANRFGIDREEQDVTTRTVARAQAFFGSTMRGAVFALSVLDQLESLGKGG